MDLVLGLEEEPTNEPTGELSFRMTEDDAWAMVDVLRQAALKLSGREPQAFIWVEILPPWSYGPSWVRPPSLG